MPRVSSLVTPRAARCAKGGSLRRPPCRFAAPVRPLPPWVGGIDGGTDAIGTKKIGLFQWLMRGSWRRGWDSNPRYTFTVYNGLANRRLQPLGHPSAGSRIRARAHHDVCLASSRAILLLRQTVRWTTSGSKCDRVAFSRWSPQVGCPGSHWLRGESNMSHMVDFGVTAPNP